MLRRGLRIGLLPAHPDAFFEPFPQKGDWPMAIVPKNSDRPVALRLRSCLRSENPWPPSFDPKTVPQHRDILENCFVSKNYESPS